MYGNIKAEKDKVRIKILLKRKRLSKNAIVKLSALISKKVLSIKKIKNANTFLVYLPINNEVDTFQIIKLLRSKKKEINLPVFQKDSKTYKIAIYDRHDKLTAGPYRIPQPAYPHVVDIAQVDVAIVPGVAFDKADHRLGFGKGIYDQLLADFSGLKIGLAYDFQILERLPREQHDLRMDLIISENKILDIRPI